MRGSGRPAPFRHYVERYLADHPDSAAAKKVLNSL